MNMPEYAMDELFSLLNGFPSPIDTRHPLVRYVCSLFAELAYYHIKDLEIDDKERAKIIPCKAFQMLVNRGIKPDVRRLFQEQDPPRFIAETNGVVAVGYVLKNILFIAFRGTIPLYLTDWMINFDAIRKKIYSKEGSGRLHRGFDLEAERISAEIHRQFDDSNHGIINHVFLTGHSLGGAVAGISEYYLNFNNPHVCIFGSPRYSDKSAYNMLHGRIPIHFRRLGDPVPTVPPKLLGYVNHPNEYWINGESSSDIQADSFDPTAIYDWYNVIDSHCMETYRHELGRADGISCGGLPLTSYERL